MTGHEYALNEQLAHERYNDYQRDAATYRAVRYEEYHSRSRRVATWLGDLLLEWGRRLRERSGEVVVEIATIPRTKTPPEHAA